MPTQRETEKLISDVLRRGQYFSNRKARTGRIDPTTGNVIPGLDTVPFPGQVWVRFEPRGEAVAAYNVGKVGRESVDLLVWVGPDANDDLEIKGPVNADASQQFGVAAPDVYAPEIVFKEQSIFKPRSLSTLRPVVKQDSSYSIFVPAAKVYGVGEWPGGEIDLTALIPTTSGNSKWVIVSLDTSTLELTTDSGSEVAYAVHESAGYLSVSTGDDALPLCAVLLYEGMSPLGEQSIVDLRTLVNLPGAGGTSGPLNNYAATTAPTADDDSGDGYSVGSVWVDVSNDIAYVCLDATATAAVWTRVSNLASPLSVANGGTGRTNLSNGHILTGNGTGGITSIGGSNVYEYPYYNGASFTVGLPGLLANQSLSGLSSVTLNPVPTGFYEIEIIILSRSTVAAINTELRMTINNDTTAVNYGTVYMAAGLVAAVNKAARNGTVASAIHAFAPGSTVLSGYYNVTIIRIPFYGSAVKRDVSWSQGLLDSGEFYTVTGNGFYYSAAAVSRLDISLVSGNWDTLSRIVVRGLL